MNFKTISAIAVAACAFAAPLTSQAKELKIATVKMNEVFEAYWKTNQIQKELNVLRTRIQKEDEDRIVKLREIEKQLIDLRKKLEDPLLNEKNKKEMLEGFNRLSQDGIAAERERRDWLERRNRALSEQMGEKMKVIMESIQLEINKQSKGEYDLVMDSSALAVTQTKFLLYSDAKFDITKNVVEGLNKDAPEEFKKAADAGQPADVPVVPGTDK